MFADVEVSGSDEVLQNWERIKAAEKKDRPLLGSVPRSLPALTRAQRVGEKVERVGFDWPDARGSRAKVAEELGELDRGDSRRGQGARRRRDGRRALRARQPRAPLRHRRRGSAPRRTIDKFQRRFAHVEARVKEQHGGWPEARPRQALRSRSSTGTGKKPSRTE